MNSKLAPEDKGIAEEDIDKTFGKFRAGIQMLPKVTQSDVKTALLAGHKTLTLEATRKLTHVINDLFAGYFADYFWDQHRHAWEHIRRSPLALERRLKQIEAACRTLDTTLGSRSIAAQLETYARIKRAQERNFHFPRESISGHHLKQARDSVKYILGLLDARAIHEQETTDALDSLKKLLGYVPEGLVIPETTDRRRRPPHQAAAGFIFQLTKVWRSVFGALPGAGESGPYVKFVHHISIAYKRKLPVEIDRCASQFSRSLPFKPSTIREFTERAKKLLSN